MSLNEILSINDLYNFARKNGLEATGNLLKEYVDTGQPDGFAGGNASFRFMCRVASEGIEDVPLGHYFSNIESRYGLDLYFYMSGCTDKL